MSDPARWRSLPAADAIIWLRWCGWSERTKRKALRSHGPKADPATQAIPVIFLTARPDPSLNRRAYVLGAVVCFTQPFRSQAVLAVVKTTLHGVPPRGKATGG
jgi:hypothetical protein